ncbi:MAG TPA: hypothetical protein VLA67_09940 [Nitrospiraceae bacterium]|nr:hypothetical protein [Nitrospiraceae bacterium]
MKTLFHTMSCRPHAMGRRRAGTGLAVLMALAALSDSSADAAPIEVRFPEGMTHGFLLVRSLAGEVIGQGEIVQVVKEGAFVESHLVFTFKDGSLHDEKVTFSQQRVFAMLRYHLVQRGPSFPDQIEVSIDRSTAEYKVRSKVGEDGKEEVLTGAFTLPKDVYNGIFVTILLNLPKGTSETVNFLAFTPRPEVIKLELLLMSEHTVRIGDLSRKALRYVFKPDIGMIRELLGKAAGQIPTKFHYDCWILADEVPSFVQFEGPLQLMGPIVRIELVSPRLSIKPEDEKISSK